MADMNEFNQRIITEFRANGGKVGKPFEGSPMVLLTTTGAKTGRRLTSPLVYSTDGDRTVIIASKAGADTNPNWYHNIVANPSVTLELGTDTFEATAVAAEGAERDRLYGQQAAQMAVFNDYAAKTKRMIPVIVMTRNG